MALLELSTDYSNRQIDVNIFFGADPSRASTETVRVEFGPISSFCAGLQKLIQRYAISLMTGLGSQPTFESFGTDLLNSLMQGVVVSTSDLRHLFNFANFKVLEEFRAYQSDHPEMPDDEKLLSAVLDRVVLDRGKSQVSLSINLTAVSGDKTKFLLPLPVH